MSVFPIKKKKLISKYKIIYKETRRCESNNRVGEIIVSEMHVCLLYVGYSFTLLLCSMNGVLEFVDTQDMTIMTQTEHFMATDVEWDPTGRYVVSAVSWWGHKVCLVFQFIVLFIATLCCWVSIGSVLNT